jgi:Na+-transporting methylmalonyl-CoA/oxaloacetate decarboxylase gamma subunit
MNPDKLFDYLEGRLPPAERTELEARLASDPELQRELAVARQIHLGMRETFDPIESARVARGAVLGRRIAIIFAALVFCNVLFGIYAITFMGKKQRSTRPNEQNQEQLNQALQSAAAAALPTPKLEVDEIKIPAPAAERDSLVAKIINAAVQSGGSAVKNLSNENGTLVFAEIPAAKENEFREQLKSLGAPATKQADSAPTGNRILQIRIVEGANH